MTETTTATAEAQYQPAPDPGDDYEKYRRGELRARLEAAGEPVFASPGFAPDGRPLPERDIMSDLAYEIEWYLRSLSIAQLACLVYGHRWPELIPGLSVPRGFRAVPSPEVRGVYLITEECTRRITIGKGERRRPAAQYCGTVRRSQTLPGTLRGLFDRQYARSYRYDNDAWEKRPSQSRLTRIDFLQEIWRRMGRDLFPAETGKGQS